MADRMIEEIRRVGNWPAGTDDEQVWQDYVQYFTGLPTLNRQAVLTFVDEDCLGHIPSVTKDSAKLMQKKRQLDDLNQAMLKAGR